MHHVTPATMSDVCKQFKGWFSSFTKTEIYLTLLQAVFLISFISIVTFLVLHFLVCLRDEDGVVTEKTQTDYYTHPTERSTLAKDLECTWTPSSKTAAPALYYEGGEVVTITPSTDTRNDTAPQNNTLTESFTADGQNVTTESDDNIAADDKNGWLLALVKVQHGDVLFGCTLTLISIHWTLTAASCLEAVEEVDTLDNFVMMERFGQEARGETHEITEVIVHPLYRGVQKSYDLVAIKSDNRLRKDGGRVVRLPTLLDISLITLGERLTVLGFGKLSLIEDSRDRRVREVSVSRLSSSQCPALDTWTARHLGRAGAARRDAGGAGGLCAGWAGGAEPCPCAGAPLLSSDLLLGVMSDDGNCGVSCTPALYVNIALQRNWLDSLLDND